MKTKTFAFAISILATVLFMSLASAAITVNASLTQLTQDGTNFTFQVTSNETESLTITTASIIDGQTITFNDQAASVTNGTAQDITITYNTNDFEFVLGQTYSTTLTIEGNTSDNVTKTVTFEETNFCEDVANEGRLDVVIEDFKVITGYGDDDDYWYLRDEVEVEFTVENEGSWDIQNVELEWELYTEEGLSIMDDSEADFDLDENDDKTITVTFKLDENIDDFDGADAVFYVRVTGEIDDRNSAHDGDNTCAYDKSSNIEVRTDEHFVIVDDLKINGMPFEDEFYEEVVACGSELTFTGRVWNIGDRDEDDVYVEVYSSLLEAYKKIEFTTVDYFDYEEFTYTLTIPQELDEKSYRLQFEVFDEDNDVFENDEDDKSISYVNFKVAGDCKFIAPTIAATLVEEVVKAGETMTVKATVTNAGDDAAVYTLTSDGFEAWASLMSVKPEVVSVPAGETKEVEFTFNLNDEAEGSREFNIYTNYDGKVVATQPVVVEVAAGTFNVKDLASKENLQIAGIVLLNLILLIAIILVARKILRKK
ncbi:MAG: putative S-layer protein [Nanoarchaeota archaeon]|nr:putative S-layer protein [Nanoarchaeota archaeon]